MTVHALVPVKRLPSAKTRLSGALRPAERLALVPAMLGDVLDALRSAPSVERVSVVTSDLAAATAATRTDGVAAVSDGGLPWNDGLARAVAWLEPRPTAVLIVAADLPLVQPEDLEALLAALPPRGIALGRAHDGGSNALALRPPDALVPNFGVPGSAARHVERAVASGLEAVVVDRPGLAYDLDTPEDVVRFLDAPIGGRRTRALLVGYRNRSASGERTSSDADPSPSAP